MDKKKAIVSEGGNHLKKRKTILALSLVLLSAMGLYGCGGRRELTRMTADGKIPSVQKPEPADDESLPIVSTEEDNPSTAELTALADTQEEAEKIAELYGIELTAYSHGVATYTTDKNLRELLDLGLENDYPTLTPDYEFELHTEQ